MGTLSKILGLDKLAELERRLFAEAGYIAFEGDRAKVLELGIEAAKLGLTVEDLQRMASVYFRLQFFEADDNAMAAVRHVLTAIREANEQ